MLASQGLENYEPVMELPAGLLRCHTQGSLK